MTDPDPPPTTEGDTPTLSPESAKRPEVEPAEEQHLDPEAAAPEVVEESSDAEPDAGGKPRRRRPKLILCPYCGHTQTPRDKCVNCNGLFEPLSRRATQIAMGPWTVRDKAQPFRPGCSYEVLKKMIAAGKIGPTTIIRGPTTRQFWSIARNVPGVAHLLGYCHGCGKHVPKEGINACPHCGVPFKAVRQRNELGLQFPHRRAAEAAQRTLNRLIHGTPGPAGESAAGESAIGDAHGSTAHGEALVDGDQASLNDSAAPAPTTIFDDDSFGSAAGLDLDPSPTDAAAPTDRAEAEDAGADLIDDVLGGPSAAVDSPSAPDTPAENTPPKPPPVVTETSNHPAALPPRRDINWLVVLLIALNVLMAVAVITFFATRGGGEG